ncbi:MAG: ABC transporter ATP-binding protein [Vicinamibacteria bacterium]
MVDLNLRVGWGEVLALFGRNGAGKTTFLQLAATLMKPTEGRFLYGEGKESSSPEEIRRGIGLVSHASFLYPDLTVRENLAFYARLYGLTKVSAVVEEAAERADLSARADSPVRSLSRGMHQRLTIARAVLHRPSLLLLDEPYTGLDPVSADRLSGLISNFREQGTAAILTTHDLERGLAIADRVAILESGRVVHEGTSQQDPKTFRKLFSDVTTRRGVDHQA